MPRSLKETGWLQRADTALAGNELDSDSEAYLREAFLSSRDRVSAIATTVAAVGTFILALLAVVVAISGSVSVEETEAVEAGEAAELLRLDCAKDKDPAGSECARLKLKQAQGKEERAKNRTDQVRRISNSQIVTGALMLAAFGAALFSQLLNPVAPPPKSGELLAGWRDVRDRYRQKRRLIELALVFDIIGVAVLVVFGLGLLA